MEKAVIVWPEGNENWSGGSTRDQQWGSRWQGRWRWLIFFNPLKTTTPASAAEAAMLTTAKRFGPPAIRRITARPYHSQPSPMRVAAIIQKRIQRGAFHRLMRRIT